MTTFILPVAVCALGIKMKYIFVILWCENIHVFQFLPGQYPHDWTHNMSNNMFYAHQNQSTQRSKTVRGMDLAGWHLVEYNKVIIYTRKRWPCFPFSSLLSPLTLPSFTHTHTHTNTHSFSLHSSPSPTLLPCWLAWFWQRTPPEWHLQITQPGELCPLTRRPLFSTRRDSPAFCHIITANPLKIERPPKQTPHTHTQLNGNVWWAPCLSDCVMQACRRDAEQHQ